MRYDRLNCVVPRTFCWIFRRLFYSGRDFWSRQLPAREWKVSHGRTTPCSHSPALTVSTGHVTFCVRETDMRPILLLLFLSLLAVQVHSLTDPRVPDMFFPFGPDEGDSVVPVGDVVRSSAVNMSAGSPFPLRNHSAVCVSMKCKFTSYLRQRRYVLSGVCQSVCLSVC